MRFHIGALLIGSLLAVATPAAAADPAPAKGGTLKFSVEAEPPNFDCHGAISFAVIHPVAPHYSTLLKFDTAQYPAVTGDLADSCTVSADKRVYTFKLRPNVLFHDGTPLTSADVKFTYDRIRNPPAGVISARQVDYASIESIETPDPLTIVFKLQYGDPAMQANFASPWNCVYSAAKVSADQQYPKTHVMGTGPFVFGAYEKGKSWTGKRFDKYFRAGHPYLDGFEAHFITGKGVVAAMKEGKIDAMFRSFTPAERDELESALGDKVVTYESPLLNNILLTFNVKKPPFDDARVRRALSLAIDRWGMVDQLSNTTFMKFVGGIMRPGFVMATPESALTALPGFSRDIAASREEARKLLAAAGQSNLNVPLMNRDIAVPYSNTSEALIEAWRSIGVTVTEKKNNTKDWQVALNTGDFSVGLDTGGDYFDDPMLQMAKFVSRDMSAQSYSNENDRILDALFIGQGISNSPRERLAIVRDFEKRALTEAYNVPILWWNRIVVTSSRLKGWNMSPSQYIGQDLGDVWLSR